MGLVRQIATAIVLILTGAAAWGQSAVLLTGDSWTGVPGWPDFVFYEEFLEGNPDITILDNLGEGGRALAINTYFSPTLPSLRDAIDGQLAGYSHGEIDYVVMTIGGNDFRLRPDVTSLARLQSAVIDVSVAIAAVGAKPVWGNIPVAPGYRPLYWFPDYEDTFRHYNDWLRWFCFINGYAYMDLNAAFIAADGSWQTNDNGESYGDEDGGHYTPVGASYLAAIVANAITEANLLQPAVATQIDVQAAWPGPALHPHHDGRMLTWGAPPDDVIDVAIMGQSTMVGDAVDFDAGAIDVATLRFGPNQGAIDPSSIPEVGVDIDGDAVPDTRVQFLMSDTGIACEADDVSIFGETTPAAGGVRFAGTDIIVTDCDAQCHY